jgi:photosystem II stability/assembly factor-like uncharacterized protein
VARLVALVACIAAGVATTAFGGEAQTTIWSAGSARLMSPTFGYAVIGWEQPHPTRLVFGGGLYLYRDGRWSKSKPYTNANGGIEDVAFPDNRHGWIATYDCADAWVSVFRTQDAGASWQRLPISSTHSCGGGPTYLSFPNTRDGWLEPVSPNGPVGILLRTTNGGATWPVLGSIDEGDSCLNRITAISASVAFMPCQRLVRTTNGGRTWQAQALPWPAGRRTDVVTSAGDPRFFGSRGVVPVTVWSRQAKAVLFYETTNDGRTWSLVASHLTGGFCGRAFAYGGPPSATVSVASPSALWVVSNRRGRVDVTNDGGRHWTSHASPLAGWCQVSGLTAGSAALAWVAPKNTRGAPLFETRDGGRTWRPVTFPLR